MRLFNFYLSSVILLAVILLGACSKDEDITPPSVSQISPVRGSFGMPVRITGNHFSANQEDNIVRFNGVQAEVDSMKDGSLYVTVPRGASSGPVTVTIDGLASLGPDFRYYDIYIVGNEDDEATSSHTPKLWKNGIEIPLPNSLNATALAITLADDDSYTTGFQFPPSGEPFFPFGYWKNDEFVSIGNSEFVADVSETVVSNEIVYVAGSYYDTPYDPDGNFRPSSVRYWKNGVRQTPAQEDYTIGRTFAIAVSGSDVYLGGVVRDNVGAYTAFWKNNTLQILGDNLEIRDVVISGTDVHLVGSGNDLSDNPLPMLYWKNGTSQPITDGTRISEATGMALDSTTLVYIIGSEMYPTSSVTGAKLWKNGAGNYIFSEEVESRGAGVAVLDHRVFTAGHVRTGANYRAYYTYDGKVYYVTDGSKNVTVTGIFVR